MNNSDKKLLEECAEQSAIHKARAMSRSQHTPTPWHDDLSTVHGPEIDAEYQEKQIVCSVINRADAAFIVRAVNAHEELLETLKEALPYLSKYGVPDHITNSAILAIAKAEGK